MIDLAFVLSVVYLIIATIDLYFSVNYSLYISIAGACYVGILFSIVAAIIGEIRNNY